MKRIYGTKTIESMMRGTYGIIIDGTEIQIDEKSFSLLKLINKHGSISLASRSLGIPYRSALSYIKRIEEALGKKIVETSRGGKGGGGSSRLTETGNRIVKEYFKLQMALEKQARVNELEGVVEEITHDGLALVRVGSALIAAPITQGLSVGDGVTALVEPENIIVMIKPPSSSIRNLFEGVVRDVERRGDIVDVKVGVDEDLELNTYITGGSWDNLGLNIGKKILVGFKAVAVTLIKI